MDEITVRNLPTTSFNISEALKTPEKELTIGKGARIPWLGLHKPHKLLLKNYRPPDVRLNLSGNVPICYPH